MLTRTHPSRWLDGPTRDRLVQRIGLALRTARREGVGTLASVSRRLEEPVDPTAVVNASRTGCESWFCLEQPDRDGLAIGTLGCAHELSGQGIDRFRAVADAWRRTARCAAADPPVPIAGAGLIAAGGFAFAPNGGSSPRWAGFAPASLVVPAVSLARRAGRTWLTVTVRVEPDDTGEDALARAERSVSVLTERPLPLLDPAPAGDYVVSSPIPPSHYEEAVARAVERIEAGELEKIVLAREVQVDAPERHDPGAVLAVLRDAFPSCFVYAVGRGDATFLGASPELLIRREGQRASTVALAGSTRRSADPAVDNHLGERLLRSAKDRRENAIVARRIAAALAPYAVWVAAAPDPGLIKVANIQHLAAPIRAQLARLVDAVELAGALHPTPAVGGEPAGVAQRLIPALEGLDRGWYAGAIGWTDAIGDGEFCVALRSAVLRGTSASCYAGGGIVVDSDPSAELAETETKLQALLPILAG